MTKQELQTTIGKNLREERVRQKLTIEQVAESASISTTFYSNLENGNKMMSVETLRKLTNALFVSSDTLLYGHDHNQSLKSIDMLLSNQPIERVEFIEKFIRLCISSIPTEDIIQREVTVPDDYGTA